MSQSRSLVVHCYKVSPWSSKLCEPFGVEGREERNGIVTSVEGEVTCKNCLKKMIQRNMKKRVEVVGRL